MALAQIDKLHVHSHAADATCPDGPCGHGTFKPRMPTEPTQPVEVVKCLGLGDSFLLHGGHIALGAEFVLDFVVADSTDNWELISVRKLSVISI